MKVIITDLLFVAITYGKVSLWLWKSLENSEFFLLLCRRSVLVYWSSWLKAVTGV